METTLKQVYITQGDIELLEEVRNLLLKYNADITTVTCLSQMVGDFKEEFEK